LVRELYDQMGFRRIGESGDEVRYELDVPAKQVITATHIRNVTASAALTKP
jgi:hypothetical protein